MTPDDDYREYLRRVWVSARVNDVRLHRSTRWERFKHWMKRRFEND